MLQYVLVPGQSRRSTRSPSRSHSPRHKGWAELIGCDVDGTVAARTVAALHSSACATGLILIDRLIVAPHRVNTAGELNLITADAEMLRACGFSDAAAADTPCHVKSDQPADAGDTSSSGTRGHMFAAIDGRHRTAPDTPCTGAFDHGACPPRGTGTPTLG